MRDVRNSRPVRRSDCAPDTVAALKGAPASPRRDVAAWSGTVRGNADGQEAVAVVRKRTRAAVCGDPINGGTSQGHRMPQREHDGRPRHLALTGVDADHRPLARAINLIQRRWITVSFRSCFRSQTQQKRISHERGAKCVKRLARSERFELPTPRFVVWCSIQLSYERVCGRASRRPGRDGVETASGASLKPSTRLGNRHPRHDASGLAQARPRLFHRGHRFILTRRRPGLQGGNVKQSPDSSIT